MELSIVILQTNRPAQATECLRSLKRARLPAETEILVINNGGHEANAAIPSDAYAGLPVRFVELERDGYVRGNNTGYELAVGRRIATVNADITLEPECIETLLAHLDANPQVGLVAPRLFYPTGTEQDSARPFPSVGELVRRRLLGGTATSPLPAFAGHDFVDVDWITGAMFIMTRRCLEVTGGHDRRFYLFMSDIALCRDAWSAGLRVRQLRDARATHHESRLSRGGLWRLLTKRTGRAHIADGLKYFLKYLGRPVPPLSPSGQPR